MNVKSAIISGENTLISIIKRTLKRSLPLFSFLECVYYTSTPIKSDPLMIELTNSCNFSCSMCGNKLMKRKKGFMDFELFRLVLDRCEEAKIPKIEFSVLGEPLLHPRFLEMLRLAAHRPVVEKIIIFTNSSMLNEKYMREIIKIKKIKITVSFSGWDKESYEKRYIGGDFNETVNKLALLNQIVRETKSPLNKLLIFGVVDSREAAKKTIYFLMNSIGLQISQIELELPCNWIDSISGKYGDGTNEQNYKNKGRPVDCPVLNKNICVLYDGRVTACGCFDVDGDLVIGDIKKQSIGKIRNGVAIKRLMWKFKQGDLRGLICHECQYKYGGTQYLIEKEQVG